MLHFIKYLILTIFLFALLNLFRSNMDAVVSLRFQVPMIYDWLSLPIALNYLMLVNFCVGILFAAFLGAFRFKTIRAKKKEIRNLKKELDDRSVIAKSETVKQSSSEQQNPSPPFGNSQ